MSHDKHEKSLPLFIWVGLSAVLALSAAWLFS